MDRAYSSKKPQLPEPAWGQFRKAELDTGITHTTR